MKEYINTLQPRLKDTSLIPTPRYYGHFSLCLGKALTFSLNSTRLIWTPVNADNGHLLLAQLTDPHRKSTLLMRTLHYQAFSYLNSTLLFSELPQIGYDDLKTPISDYFSIKRVMQRPCSNVFSPRNDGFVKVRNV